MAQSSFLSGLVLVIVGLIGVFWGYRVFRILLPLYGAVAGYLVAYHWLGQSSIFLALVIGVILAVLFALLAYLYWSVLVTIAGVILGIGIAALIAGSLNLGNFLFYVLAVVFAVVFGWLLWKIRDELIIILTVLFGAGAAAEGVGLMLGLRTGFVAQLQPNPTWLLLLVGVVWIVLVIVGLLWQWPRYRHLGLYGFGGPVTQPAVTAPAAMPKAAPAPAATPQVSSAAPSQVATRGGEGISVAGAAAVGAGAAVVASKVEEPSAPVVDAAGAADEVGAGTVVAAGAVTAAATSKGDETVAATTEAAGEATEAASGAAEAASDAGIGAVAAAGAVAVSMADKGDEAADMTGEAAGEATEAASGAAEAAGDAGAGTMAAAAAVVTGMADKGGDAVDMTADAAAETEEAAQDQVGQVIDQIEKTFGLEDMAKFKEALEFVEGVGPAYAEKLRAAGVLTVLDLLRRGSTRKGRVELVEATGIAGKLILKWVNHADLYRIKGVGSEYADLLEAAGVDTVVELAQRNPANLLPKMVSVNEEKKLVRKTPFQSQVDDWVAQAKGLDRMIQY